MACPTAYGEGFAQTVPNEPSFTHRPDATIATATHAGQTSTYTRSPAGWVESMTDWANKVSTTAYSPAGSPTATSLGGSASSLRSYKPDGSSASLVWTAGGSSVRSHTAMAYDLGGLRTAETVSVAYPAGTTGADTGGAAGFSYDLLGRLGSYTSPFKTPGASTEPTVSYTLDDGANILSQTTTVAAATVVAESSEYPNGRLASRARVLSPPGGPNTTADLAFGYSTLGEETSRSTTGTPSAPTITTTYDAAGHVASAEGVTYLYDGDDHLLARTKGADTTMYFYWGPGSLLAEETDGAGDALASYVADGAGGLIAQHTWRRLAATRTRLTPTGPGPGWPTTPPATSPPT